MNISLLLLIAAALVWLFEEVGMLPRRFSILLVILALLVPSLR